MTNKLTRKEKLNKAINEIWDTKIVPELKEMAIDLADDDSFSNGNKEELIVDIDGNMTRHTIGQGMFESWYKKIKQCKARVVAEIPYNWAEACTDTVSLEDYDYDIPEEPDEEDEDYESKKQIYDTAVDKAWKEITAICIKFMIDEDLVIDYIDEENYYYGEYADVVDEADEDMEDFLIV